MTTSHSEYLIIGCGLAGTSAVEGIREIDHEKPITMIGAEKVLPYDRPPLSKDLWFGKTTVDKVFLHDKAFYDENNVALLQDRRVIKLDAKNRMACDNRGNCHSFGTLLIATGGVPQTLSIPGGTGDGITYYRYLDDYQKVRSMAVSGAKAVVIGGGFIGSEMAAALCNSKVEVTMIYPETHLCERVFPAGLGEAMERTFQARGIRILHQEKPVSIGHSKGRYTIKTLGGKTIECGLVIAGIGIKPVVELAGQEQLATENGINVDEYLETSCKGIYAAGDNARFPSPMTGHMVRIEHWDNASTQGKLAGRNMAGAREIYTTLPFFFSDLFEFGYEAVGDINPALEIFTDWQKENEQGVVYYLKENKVRGVMLCNIPHKTDEARELINNSRPVMMPEDLRGAITQSAVPVP
jgi:3-phenylpropionate/trans-cinnamate dioxygenase ferredoxin reductase component